MIRSRLWIAGAAFVAVLSFAVVRTSRTEDSVPIRVESPIFQDLDTIVSTNGKVTPIEDFSARAALSTTVDKMYVHIGDKVRSGQQLMQLSDPFAPSRYTAAVAGLQNAQLGDSNIRANGSQEDRINFAGDLQRAQLELADAEKQLAVIQELAKTGAASQGEVESEEHRLAAAKASVDTITERNNHRYSANEASSSAARVKDAKSALETARSVLANANITSGIAGTVYALPVSEYDFVPMGTELVRVADLSKLQVHAYVDEPDMGQLAVDQRVVVTWEARPNRSWHGHVKQVPLTVTTMGPRIVGDCVITIDDADGTLLPNTDVTVRITTRHLPHVLTVSREAVHTEGQAHFVFLVAGNRLIRTPVGTGTVTLDRTEVLSGVKEGDILAAHATILRDLTDHLRVAVMK